MEPGEAREEAEEAQDDKKKSRMQLLKGTWTSFLSRAALRMRTDDDAQF